MSAADERRAQHARYKQDVEERGKPFYPYAMFHDTVMSLVVVSVIVALAAIWYFTSGSGTEEGDSGWLGKRYDEAAQPGTTNFIPRPDWYFFFLFYLLRIFKWPESVVLGTVGVPTIALVMLLALPFVDRRRERRLLLRPVALVGAVLTALTMGVLTWKGATVRESSGAEAAKEVETWVAENRLPEEAREGAAIFAEVGCLNCHLYLGEGSSNLGAPVLDEEGTRNRGVEWQIDHMDCPSCVTPGSAMQAYPREDFGEENLRKIAVFLECSPGSAPACNRAKQAAASGG